MASVSYREVDSIYNLPAPDESGRISHYVFQYIDFGLMPQYIAAGHRFCDCFFFGCEIPSEMEGQIGSTCLVFQQQFRYPLHFALLVRRTSRALANNM